MLMRAVIRLNELIEQYMPKNDSRHAGEKVQPLAGVAELFFVEIDRDADSAGEAGRGVGQAADKGFALDGGHAGNPLLGRRIAAEIVQLEDAAEGLGAAAVALEGLR